MFYYNLYSDFFLFVLDFEQNWKMLHYYAKDFFAPLIITSTVKTDRSVDIFLINDLLPIYNASVFINVYNWKSFNPIDSINLTVNIVSK